VPLVVQTSGVDGLFPAVEGGCKYFVVVPSVIDIINVAVVKKVEFLIVGLSKAPVKVN